VGKRPLRKPTRHQVNMPTGVPIHDIRGQLLDAAQRILVRDGPDALTSRAVTTETGVAKGILHRHFADFDTFLVALVLRRIEDIDAQSADLRAAAGTAALDDTLVSALADALDTPTLQTIRLVCGRRSLTDRLRLSTPTGIPILAQITTMISAYLTAERGLGRIALTVDIDTLGVMLVGGAYLIATADDGPATGHLHEIVTTALQNTTAPTQARTFHA
jgi:AcrR family transcriptional regulator